MTSGTRISTMALVATLLAGAGPCGTEPPEPPKPGQSVAIKGRLTDEGVECPAMRDEHGTLYTLTTRSLDGFRIGDQVCVRGKVAEVSFCMQGITIAVESIRQSSDCP